MDHIHLDLAVRCVVGILPRERLHPQPVRVTVRMDVDLEAAATTGELHHSIDYGAVDTQVRFLCTEGRFRLIESLAIAIARLLLLPPAPGEARAALACVAVSVFKPEVLDHAVASVHLERAASWARGATTLIDLEEVTALRLDGPPNPALGEGVSLAVGDGALWVQSRPWSP